MKWKNEIEQPALVENEILIKETVYWLSHLKQTIDILGVFSRNQSILRLPEHINDLAMAYY